MIYLWMHNKCLMEGMSYLWNKFLIEFNLFMQVNFMNELETSFWDFVHKFFEEKIIWYLFLYNLYFFPCSFYNVYFYGIVSSQWFKTLLFDASTFYSKTSSSIRLFCIVWKLGTWSVCKNAWVLFLFIYMINKI